MAGRDEDRSENATPERRQYGKENDAANVSVRTDSTQQALEQRQRATHQPDGMPTVEGIADSEIDGDGEKERDGLRGQRAGERCR